MSKPNLGVIKPKVAKDFNPNLPDEDLVLTAAFGYAGDIRGDLAYNNSDEIVYFTAGVGVIQDREGHQKFHQGHMNDISSWAIDVSRKFIATGDMCCPGDQPVIRIWSPDTGNLISNIKSKTSKSNPLSGHLLEKQIVALGFSMDGSKLACVGDDNNHSTTLLSSNDGWKTYTRIYSIRSCTSEIVFAEFLDNNTFYTGGEKVLNIFQIDSQDIRKGIFGKCPQDKLLCGLSLGSKFVVGCKGGSVYLLNGGNMSDTKKSHSKAVTCLASHPKGFISGSLDFFIMVWDNKGTPLFGFDMNEVSKLVRNVPNALVGGINALYCKDNKILVGTRRCNIIEVIVEDKKAIDALMIAEGHAHCEVWGCSADPLNPNIVVSVGDDKDLFIWDINTKLPKNIYHLPLKSRSIDIHPNNGLLAVGLGGRDGKSTDPSCDDGGFMILDINTLEVVYQKKKMSEEWISAIKWSSDGSLLAVGSHDNFIYVYDSNDSYKLKFKFTKGSSYVNQCDWSKDNEIIRACYGDFQLLYIDTSSGQQITSSSAIANKEWNTNNSMIGWGVQGIWAETNDKTDINACCTNSDESLLVAVDDMNTVRLYRYPCLNKTAQFKKFYGHSSHIPYCEFTFDDKGLVTCGGNDHTVLYWTVRK